MIIASMSIQSAAGVAPLPHWGVILAEGPQAASFLQSQLTNDVEHLGADRANLAGWCSAKGRLLASFIVWRPAPDRVLLAASADLLADTLQRLSMFVLRARCKLSDVSATVPLSGIMGASSRLALGLAEDLEPWHCGGVGAASVIRLPDGAGVPRWLWAGAAAPPLPAAQSAAWDALEIQAGIVRIVARTVDQFVPQMVNFELVGGVDFRKGCFPGQEVVARSQYRGTIKRRTFRFDTDGTAAAGDEVFDRADPGQPAGMVANAAPCDGMTALLVELKTASSGAELHLRAPDGPLLRRATLPYALPSDA